MKLYQLFLILILLVVGLMIPTPQGAVQDFRTRVYTKNASTSTAVTCGTYTPGRRWWVITNESVNYDCRVATWPLTVADLSNVHPASRGWPLAKDLGSLDDKILCYQSTYYVLLSSIGAPGDATPLTAPVTWMERD